MTVISREIINKDLSLTIFKDSKNIKKFNYDEVINLIDCAKTFLVNERNAKTNDKVLICPCDFYIPWFFACAELGLTFLVSLSHNPKDYKQVNDQYGHIDHVIVPHIEYFSNIAEQYANVEFDADVLKIYSDTSCKEDFWSTKDSILTLSISETNVNSYNPAQHSHPHWFYYQLLERNIRVLKLTSSDKCMHSKILHHGSSLGIFFLPTIKHCSIHYWALEHSDWHNLIVNEQINRCLFMYYDIITFPAKLAKRVTDLSNLTIYTLRSPSPKDVDYLVKKCNATITSMFGTTITSGPVFLQEVNLSNCDTYDKGNFGKPLDEYYQLCLTEGRLTIKTFGKTVITPDYFKIVNNEFYFI